MGPPGGTLWSRFWQGLFREKFLMAFSAAEKELLSLESNCVGLGLGNITFTDRILNQFLSFSNEVLGALLFRGEGFFYDPVNNRQNDYRGENTPHNF